MAAKAWPGPLFEGNQFKRPHVREEPATREDLERRAKEEAEEEAKQEAQKAYDETYADIYDAAYERILDELLDEHGFSD